MVDVTDIAHGVSFYKYNCVFAYCIYKKRRRKIKYLDYSKYRARCKGKSALKKSLDKMMIRATFIVG